MMFLCLSSNDVNSSRSLIESARRGILLAQANLNVAMSFCNSSLISFCRFYGVFLWKGFFHCYSVNFFLKVFELFFFLMFLISSKYSRCFFFVHKKYMNYKVVICMNCYRGFPQPCGHKCDNSRKSYLCSHQRVAAQLHQFRVLECVFRQPTCCR